MSYATRRRRHDLTLGDKMEVIRMIDNRTSQTDIAKLYNCSQSQISRIASRRDEIIEDWENCDDPEQKKRRFVTGDDQEAVTTKDETVQTLTDKSTSPLPPSENTFDGSEQSQTPDTSNNGWLEYWKNHSSSFGRRSYGDFDPDFSPWNRHYGSGSGGKKSGRGRPRASANKESRISNQLLDILKNYDLCDVYCADELALHYDAMPNLDSSQNEGEEEEEGDSEKKDCRTEMNQKQITVFLTCNVTGSDKRDFLIIEDSKRSEATATAIPGCHRAKAPHAWMTSDVFSEYLLALDYDMRKQRRYILLLVDNAPPHIPEAGKSLEHVRVLYVRSYATPFFHGIFYSVRAHYRKQILLKIFAQNPKFSTNGNAKGKGRKSSTGSQAVSVTIDFEEAVSMLKQAWQSTSPQDIVQCFSKAGICAPHIHGLPESSGDDLPELPEGFITDEQYEDFVNIDVDAECSGDADLVSAECRILSDLRQQGFTDVGLEPSEDLPLDTSGLNSSGNSNSLTGSTPKVLESVPSSGGVARSESKSETNVRGEVQRALNTLRNFLERRGLHLHNLHALEAQISCDGDAGGR